MSPLDRDLVPIFSEAGDYARFERRHSRLWMGIVAVVSLLAAAALEDRYDILGRAGIGDRKPRITYFDGDTEGERCVEHWAWRFGWIKCTPSLLYAAVVKADEDDWTGEGPFVLGDSFIDQEAAVASRLPLEEVSNESQSETRDLQRLLKARSVIYRGQESTLGEVVEGRTSRGVMILEFKEGMTRVLMALIFRSDGSFVVKDDSIRHLLLSKRNRIEVLDVKDLRKNVFLGK